MRLRPPTDVIWSDYPIQIVGIKDANLCMYEIKCNFILFQIPSGASGLPTNYIAQNIIEKMKSSKEEAYCHDCVVKVPAEKHCQTCVLNLCGDCSKYHQGCVRFVGHKIVDVSKAPQQSFASKRYCRKHAELLKYFCETCKVLVCNDCMVSNQHKQHVISLESEVKEKGILDLKQKLENVQESSITLLQYKKEGEEFKAKIEKENEEAIKLVKQVFDEIRVKLSEKEQEAIKSITAKSGIASFDEFTKATNKVTSTVNYVKSLLEDQKCEDLEMTYNLISQLDQLSTKYQLVYQQQQQQQQPHQQQQHYTEQYTQQYTHQRQQPLLVIQQKKLFKKKLGNLNFCMQSHTTQLPHSRGQFINNILNRTFKFECIRLDR